MLLYEDLLRSRYVVIKLRKDVKDCDEGHSPSLKQARCSQECLSVLEWGHKRYLSQWYVENAHLPP